MLGRRISKQCRLCALLFLVSVAVRTVLALQMFASDAGTPYLTGDAKRYMESAVDLLARGWFTDRGVLSCYQGPGYTVFVALVVFLFGQSEESVVGSQILLSAATACLVYAIAREISRPSTTYIPAVAAGLAAALNFGLVSFSVQLMSETLAVFLLMLSVFFCLRFAKRSNNYDLFLSALCLGARHPHEGRLLLVCGAVGADTAYVSGQLASRRDLHMSLRGDTDSMGNPQHNTVWRTHVISIHQPLLAVLFCPESLGALGRRIGPVSKANLR